MTQQQADAVHRADRKNARTATAFMAVGVLALVLRMVVGSGSGSGGVGSFLAIGAVMAFVIGIVMLVMQRNIGGRHQAVAALRPGSDVFEVWGAAGLKQALATEGVTVPKMSSTQGTALTMTTTASGLELWRGSKPPQVLLALPWSAITEVAEGRGVVANDGAKPAVVLVTTRGTELVLLPARKATGSLMTARLEDVRATIARLEGLRAAQ